MLGGWLAAASPLDVNVQDYLGQSPNTCTCLFPDIWRVSAKLGNGRRAPQAFENRSRSRSPSSHSSSTSTSSSDSSPPPCQAPTPAQSEPPCQADRPSEAPGPSQQAVAPPAQRAQATQLTAPLAASAAPAGAGPTGSNRGGGGKRQAAKKRRPKAEALQQLGAPTLVPVGWQLEPPTLGQIQAHRDERYDFYLRSLTGGGGDLATARTTFLAAAAELAARRMVQPPR